MFKGAPRDKTDYAIGDIRGFIEDLEKKSSIILEEPKSLIAMQNNIAKELEEYRNIATALKAHRISIWTFLLLKISKGFSLKLSLSIQKT